MKRFLLAAAVWAALAQPAAAQVVTAEGFGLDREGALRAAQRNAVELAVGTFVDARTIVENARVALDEIYTRAYGFVTRVDVLSEGAQADGSYRVLAAVDVNTSPDAELAGRLRTVMALNDPRIAVVVLHESGDHDAAAETAMNEMLIAQGFGHVIDADIVAAVEDARLLERVYRGGDSGGISGVGSSLGADFLVLGRSRSEGGRVTLPDFKGGYYEHGMMSSGRADLTVKIIRFDTGDIVGSFAVEGRGMDVSPERAETRALKDAAAQAAETLTRRFRHIASAAATGGLRITASAWDYAQVEAFAGALRGMTGVKGVTIREHRDGKAILDVDTTEAPAALARAIRQRTGAFVEGVSAGGIRLILN
ncbi:MAG: hypothetical protein IJU05_04355 [Schwartzia sp.]|nr:hypothetical protein [Schwartzia sp. (in: firmicutes)]